MKPKCSNTRFQTPPETRGGFTLVELLVVLAIVAVLILLQLPTMARATRQVTIAQCSRNLRQFACTLQVYGSEFNDKLPSNFAAGHSAWDIAWPTGDLLERYGAPWNVLYCPGRAPRMSMSDNYELYRYVNGSFRVIGYATTFPDTFSVYQENQNPTLFVPVVFGKRG